MPDEKNTRPAPVAETPEKLEVAERTGFVIAREWMDNNLAGGPLARNTELWNVVHDALPALGKLIDAK